MTPTAVRSRTLTLVFTDLADSTALKAKRGDQAVGDLIQQRRNATAASSTGRATAAS
jgi:class 3 adenylate cyclase